MTEKIKADQYMKYLDRILAGDKEFEIIDDNELGRLLQTAKDMMAIDFSLKSKIRDQLRQQLMKILFSQDKSSIISTPDFREDEDEL